MRTNIRAAAIIVKDDQILLMHRVKKGKEYWVLPGGGVEEGETPEETVLREIKEETSLSVRLVKLLYHDLDISNTDGNYYLCQYIKGIPHLDPNSSEQKANDRQNGNWHEIVWVDINKLHKLLLYPIEIRDKLINDIPRLKSSII